MSWANTSNFPTPYDGNIDGYEDDNAPPVVFTCNDCGDDICEGDDYYDIDDNPVCPDCIEKLRRTAYA